MRRLDEIYNLHLPRWEELPDFEIYVDQIVNIVEGKLMVLQFKEDEKILTKSMVNNYVKQGIVDPPVKKRYNKVHIAYLLVVCILKSVYSLDEITKMIALQIRKYPIDSSYNYFLDEFEACLKSIIKKQPIEHIEASFYDNEGTVILCQEIILSVAYKISVESSMVNLK